MAKKQKKKMQKVREGSEETTTIMKPNRLATGAREWGAGEVRAVRAAKLRPATAATPTEPPHEKIGAPAAAVVGEHATAAPAAGVVGKHAKAAPAAVVVVGEHAAAVSLGSDAAATAGAAVGSNAAATAAAAARAAGAALLLTEDSGDEESEGYDDSVPVKLLEGAAREAAERRWQACAAAFWSGYSSEEDAVAANTEEQEEQEEGKEKGKEGEKEEAAEVAESICVDELEVSSFSSSLLQRQRRGRGAGDMDQDMSHTACTSYSTAKKKSKHSACISSPIENGPHSSNILPSRRTLVVKKEGKSTVDGVAEVSVSSLLSMPPTRTTPVRHQHHLPFSPFMSLQHQEEEEDDDDEEEEEDQQKQEQREQQQKQGGCGEKLRFEESILLQKKYLPRQQRTVLHEKKEKNKIDGQTQQKLKKRPETATSKQEKESFSECVRDLRMLEGVARLLHSRLSDPPHCYRAAPLLLPLLCIQGVRNKEAAFLALLKARASALCWECYNVIGGEAEPGKGQRMPLPELRSRRKKLREQLLQQQQEERQLGVQLHLDRTGTGAIAAVGHSKGGQKQQQKRRRMRQQREWKKVFGEAGRLSRGKSNKRLRKRQRHQRLKK